LFEPGRFVAGLRGNAGAAIGLLLAAGAVAVALASAGYELPLVRDLVFGLNAAVNGRFRFGLVSTLMGSPHLLLLIAAGACIEGIAVFRRRGAGLPGASYLAAIALWCLVQAAFVNIPYFQYAAPWLLFASVFIAAAFDAAIGASNRMASITTPLLYVLVAACAIWTIVDSRRDAGAARRADGMRWMLKLTNPEDRVVAPPAYHPLFRRDVFYVWWNIPLPNGNGVEALAASLPAIRDRFEASAYKSELAANPPALVVMQTPDLPTFYPDVQGAEVLAFLEAHGYQLVERNGLVLALRPDVSARTRGASRERKRR
jgi:hypothetical protein